MVLEMFEELCVVIMELKVMIESGKGLVDMDAD